MSPAERETPAGEAMREAVIARAMEAFNKRYGYHRPVIEDLLVDFGEILVDFAAEAALTTAVARARREALEEAAGYHDDWQSRNYAAGSSSTARRHAKYAAAIRALYTQEPCS